MNMSRKNETRSPYHGSVNISLVKHFHDSHMYKFTISIHIFNVYKFKCIECHLLRGEASATAHGALRINGIFLYHFLWVTWTQLLYLTVKWPAHRWGWLVVTFKHVATIGSNWLQSCKRWEYHGRNPALRENVCQETHAHKDHVANRIRVALGCVIWDPDFERSHRLMAYHINITIYNYIMYCIYRFIQICACPRQAKTK